MGRVWFVSSERGYPVDDRLPNMSSTTIRTLLDRSAEQEAYDAIKDMAVNPKELLLMFKQQQCSQPDESVETTMVAQTDTDANTSTALV
jgi:hypothetical protein